MSDVPSELFREILSYLPVESLLRFRSVSKAWRSLIDDSDFIKLHLRRQTDQERLIFQVLGTGTRLYALSLNFFKCSEQQRSKFTEVTAFKQLMGSALPILVGFPKATCHGLILLSHEYVKKIWALWNPFTLEFLHLPQYSDVMSSSPGCFRASGLGYDVMTDDYKVVRLAQLYDSSNESYLVETLVYCVKLDCWRRIDNLPNCFLPKHQGPGVFANGALHWLAFVPQREVAMNYIIAFDLGTETYRWIPIPESGRDLGRMYFDCLGGCLFLTCHYMVGRLDVWKMNDYGGEDLWIKLFSFRQPANMGVMKNVQSVAYLKNKEQVLLMYNEEEFVWFDIRKESAKKVTLNGVPSIFSLQAFPASLVRLNSNGRAGKIPLWQAFPASVFGLNSKGQKKRKRGHDRLRLTLTTTDLLLSPADNLPQMRRITK